jgi:hypothetical protein
MSEDLKPRTVSEYMALSVLRVFYTVKDNEKMRTFLASVLSIQWPVLGPFHEFSDQYWTCRMDDELAHDGLSSAWSQCNSRIQR